MIQSSSHTNDRVEVAGGLPILHVTAAVGRTSFGVGTVVQELSEAQRHWGACPVMWTNDTDTEANDVRRVMNLRVDDLVTYPVIGPRRFAYSPAMERAAGEGEFPIAHVHGVWIACSRVALQRQQRFGHPYILSAHGSLDPWALRRSRLKKWLAGKAFADSLLWHASCLHAMGENEVEAYRRFGLKNPVALIPNGVSDAWIGSTGDGGRFRQHFDLGSDTRLLLFLSRVTPKKGLPLLFEAMATLRKQLNDWQVVIAGPDEFGHTAQLREIVRTLELESQVRFVGPVYGDLRRDAFSAAEAFVLPTHSEGNPLAALEAMGAGVPVLTTRGAPCDYLLERDCGWWTDIDSRSIGDALEQIVGSDVDALAAKGQRGRQLVQEQFTWTKIGKMTLQLYEWLLGRASQPDFVLTNGN